MSETAPNEGYRPTCVTAEGLVRWALAVFLEEPVPYTIFRPVGGQAGWFGFVEDVDIHFDFTDDGSFRFLEELISFSVPAK